MNITNSDILILLPAFNEGVVIESVISKLKQQGYPHICVVNDGSSDDTLQRALQAGALVLTHPINRGAGAAIQTGITYARNNDFQYLISMDSDGQHLAEDIENLCKKMETSRADIVVGNRFSLASNAIPSHRIFYNRIANGLTNFFCQKKYSDTQSGLRLLNRKAIEEIQLKNRGFSFCSEMLIFAERSQLQVEETPIQVLYSDYSMSKGQNLIVGIKTAKDILWRIIFN